MADVGGATAKLSDVCSYPSASRPSDPSDCVITPTAPTPTATIQVKKVVSPSADTGTFNLNIGADTYATGGNGTDTGGVSVTPGTGIVVNETAASGTNLANYTTTVACTKNGKSLTGTTDLTNATKRSITISAADKDNVACTFTNTRKTARVTVLKVVKNDNGGALKASSFSVSNDGAVTKNAFVATTGDNGKYEYASLPVGASYTFTEPEANTRGYTTDQSGCANVVVLADGSATCTITNDDNAPSLKVVKNVVNDNGGTGVIADFGIKLGGSALSFGAGVTSGKTTTYTASPVVLANTAYTLSEQDLSAYTEGAWSCVDGSGATVGTKQGLSASFTPALGQSITCTITNDDTAPVLTLVKKMSIKYGGTAVATDWTLSASQNGIAVVSGAGGAASGATFQAGTYDLAESTSIKDAGLYSASAWQCTGGAQNGTKITVGAGETATCEITNSDTPASLLGSKFIVNADSSPVQDQALAAGVTIDLYKQAQDGSWSVFGTTQTDANGNYSFEGLVSGMYRVVETLADDFTNIFGATNVDDAQNITIGMGLQVGDHNDDNEANALYDFGNFQNGSIKGVKWQDDNGNGTQDEDENGLADWTIFIDEDGDKVLDKGEMSQQTVVGGNYTFSDLAPGTYRVCEVQQADWKQIYPAANACHEVTISESNQTEDNVDFGNQPLAYLKIVKDIFPNDDDGSFDLLIDGEVKKAGATDMQDTGFVTLPAGTHSVSEAGSEGVDLDHYDSIMSCVREGEEMQFLYGWVTSSDVTLERGDKVTCTFTNQRHGELTIVKEAQPNDAQDFEFMLSYKRGEDTFLLDDDPTDETLSDSITYELSGAYYGLYEMPTEGWDLTDLDCGDALIDFDSETGWVTVSVEAGAHVTCVFTNTKRASVSVTKDAQPNSSQAFSFTTSLQDYDEYEEEGELALMSRNSNLLEAPTNFSLTDDGVMTALATKTFHNVMPGTYTITEADVAGWSLSSIRCTGAEVTRSGATATVVVEPGAEVHCTFVNQKNPEPQVLGVTITKSTPKLQDTGTSLFVPIALALITTLTAFAVAFDKQRQALVEKSKRLFAQPFMLPL